MSLTNMQYDEIIRSYNRISLKNKRAQKERIAQINKAVPRIREIHDEITSLSVDTAKLLLQKESLAPDNVIDSCMADYRARINALRQEKLALLAKNGYPADYLELHYNCTDCKDTGYIHNRKCHCFKRAEIELLYDQSNLRDLLSLQNFDVFDLQLYDDNAASKDASTGKTPRENMTNVLALCHHFTDHFLEDTAKYRNLLLFGKTGVGKTFLTYCIAKELLDKAFSVIYLSAIHFFEILSSAAFDKQNTEAKGQADYIAQCDLLIIDDLGTELSNSFTNSAFFNIINERLLAGKAVIISTNLVFPELMERYSERLTSRLTREYTFLKIYGDDLRHRML